MTHLIYKELKLGIHKFFFILPILLGLLMFIPGWIYLLVFMYFFWISIPQIFAAYNTNSDYNMSSSLPVRRKDIVTSKVCAIIIIELLHVVFAVIFAFFHNYLYGSGNFFMDINLAFFGVGLLMYGVYNIVFLPLYFKTAHFFGVPAIIGAVVTLVYAFIFEFGVIQFQFMRDVFEGSLGRQSIVFVVSVIGSIILSFIALKKSQHNFSTIDL